MDALWSEPERAGVMRMLAATASGGPDKVRRELQAIIDRTRADELIVAGAIHDHAARLRSYELLAQVAGLMPPAARSA
jgi:alkanesulfonate monooxygenase SsuD/methylene tetrahydromethanopterin reductase-like flavin-dependent oxidoreductase (luciferase family)